MDVHGPSCRSRNHRRAGGLRKPTEAGTALPLTNSIPRVVLLIDRDSMTPNDPQPVRASAQEFVDRLPDDFLIAAAPLPLSRSIRFERDRSAGKRASQRRSLAVFNVRSRWATSRVLDARAEGEVRNRPFVPSQEDKKVRADNTASQLQLEQSAVLARSPLALHHAREHE